ncbi:MAG: methyltransferase [Acidilobus sp.]
MASRGGWRKVITSTGEVTYFQDPCAYEPSDDTWVAIEALERLKGLGQRFERILDMGSGTGILGAVARALFNPTIIAAVDLSPFAAQASRLTLGADACVVQCYAANCLRGRFDLVVLNPPYLPTPREEDDICGGLSAAWSEEAGHEVLCAAASRLGRYVLIVMSSLSRLNVDFCLSSVGLSKVAELARRRLFFEEVWAEVWSSEATLRPFLRP